MTAPSPRPRSPDTSVAASHSSSSITFSAMPRPPIVYIDRHYDDDLEADYQPWPRRRRWPDDPVWGGYCEYGDHGEESGFDDVEVAIAWGRERAEIVFVRLGAMNDTVYSAGRMRARTRPSRSGVPARPRP